MLERHKTKQFVWFRPALHDLLLWMIKCFMGNYWIEKISIKGCKFENEIEWREKKEEKEKRKREEEGAICNETNKKIDTPYLLSLQNYWLTISLSLSLSHSRPLSPSFFLSHSLFFFPSYSLSHFLPSSCDLFIYMYMFLSSSLSPSFI